MIRNIITYKIIGRKKNIKVISQLNINLGSQETKAGNITKFKTVKTEALEINVSSHTQ